MKLPWLDPQVLWFPDTRRALSGPNGLLAAGGQLSIAWLLAAYRKGIFPWFNEGDPILWWTPSPRMVLYPYQFHISRSLRKALRKGNYRVTVNQDFDAVITACAAPRPGADTEPGTWITPVMFDAYRELHSAGHAHSVEVWRGNQLIGGLYGVALGQIFYGESMFSLATNGSKIALSHLVAWLKQWHYKMIDCQLHSEHLASLGAIWIDRISFERMLKNHVYCQDDGIAGLSRVWAPQDITRSGDYWTKTCHTCNDNRNLA